MQQSDKNATCQEAISDSFGSQDIARTEKLPSAAGGEKRWTTVENQGLSALVVRTCIFYYNPKPLIKQYI